MMTTEDIAGQVHEVIRKHHGDRPEWKRTTAQYKADLIELVKYRLDNPDIPVGAHHANYVRILAARGESHQTPEFSQLSAAEVEEDLKAVEKILELRPQWSGQ